MSLPNSRAVLFAVSGGLALIVGAGLWLGGSKQASTLFVVFGAAAVALAAFMGWRRPSPSAAAATEPSTAAPKLTLGRYEIERELGRGAMGAVFLGRDPATGLAVALKTLPMQRSDDEDDANAEEARARFVREAETARRLHHADIITVYEAGETNGLGWIAMELLQGQDLAHYTAIGNLLPVPVVLRIAARVALALAYAHAQGIVHRDVKPANVIVDPASDSVKVADFGIARIADSSRTRTGMVLGTPLFMAPEQMAGGRVDGRSDLYALGVMLFQLLTGHLPFEAGTLSALMTQIANEPAPDIRHWRPELPEALANIVAVALQKRPEMRYADGQQMADDLRAVEASLADA